jgi:hypothetical protein
MRVRQSLIALPPRLTINHPRQHEPSDGGGASVGSNSMSVHVGLCPSSNLLKSNSFESSSIHDSLPRSTPIKKSFVGRFVG